MNAPDRGSGLLPRLDFAPPRLHPRSIVLVCAFVIIAVAAFLMWGR